MVLLVITAQPYSEKYKMQNKYDVIVIGAGIGGLAAGAILSRKGKKVLVIEKNPVAGGYVVNFRRGNFEFDTSLHLIDGFVKGGYVYEVANECGILDKIELLKPKYLFRSIYPDFDINVPQTNLKEYIDLLGSLFPQEYSNIVHLFKEMTDIFGEAKELLYTYFPYNLELIMVPLKYHAILKYFTKTYQQMLGRYIKDERLKAIISQLWPYFGLPPSKLSAFYYVFPYYDYLCSGGYYPKGGARSLVDTFLSVIEDNGGEIRLKTEVKKIIVKNRLAQGVLIEKDEFIGGDFIISNIDTRKTFLTLIGIDNLPLRYVNRIKNLQPSISAFQIYLGLKCNLKELGYNDYEIFYNPSYDIDRQFSKGVMGCDIKENVCVLTISSNINSFSPLDNKSIMEISVLSNYDFWASLKKEEYNDQKQRVAQDLIKQAEKIMPGLSSNIEKIEIATPLTMERYTGNYKGAIYGWSQIISQSGINRLKNSTPISNLYLASAWTRMGGGVSMVTAAGAIAAKRILSKR